VAEILHIGSYDKEKPTVDRLTKFISDNGYRIIGDHEEEYVKGPGMLFKGNSENYRTIIRYRIEK
jgi:effector-binding domain-containing protein